MSCSGRAMLRNAPDRSRQAAVRFQKCTDEGAAVGSWPLVAQAKQDRQGSGAEMPDKAAVEALRMLADSESRGGTCREFGAWDAVYNRFRRWVHSGSRRPVRAADRRPRGGEVRRVLIDSTTVRAAPARGRSPAAQKKLRVPELSAAFQGLGQPRRADHQGDRHGRRREHGPGGGPRSRPGERLRARRAIVLHRTLKRGPVDEVVGDKGFDGDALRGGLIDRDVCPVIPNKRNRVDPWPFDERGVPGAEQGGATVRQSQAVPPGGNEVRQAPGHLPRPAPRSSGSSGAAVIRQHGLDARISARRQCDAEGESNVRC